MLAVTVWQPWASLIAVGAKRFETRSWGPAYRGELAIHAGGRQIRELADPLDDVVTLMRGELRWLGVDPDRLPLGAVVAVVDLAAVVAARDVIGMVARGEVPTVEVGLGDFRAGRVAWDCRSVRRLAEPVPCRGSQSLWRVPRDVEAAVRAQL